MDALYEWTPATKRGQILTAVGTGMRESPEYKRANARPPWTGGLTSMAATLRRPSSSGSGQRSARLGAELIKAGRVEEAVAWLDRRLTR